MRNVLLAVFMMFFTLSIVASEVQAKRLGGGFSLGKSFSSPKKVSPSPTQQKAPAQNTSGSSAKKSGFGGMGGMLGGLLAGGLLASLFMGGAFDGIQMMDILMIAAFAFIAFKLFSMMRKSQVTPSYAGAQHRSMEPSETHHFTPMSAANTQLSQPDLVLPKWFNKVTFLDGAREHFTHLQSSWDKQDWDDLATYTSEELLEQLKQERSKYPAQQHTEVVSVMSELINFIDNQDHVVASINFYGWLKESGDQQTSEFNEIWHLTRNMAEENASWHIVGIEQP